MGHRSTVTSQCYNITWPGWIREKYAEVVVFGKPGFAVYTTTEHKSYGRLADLASDLQRAIDWETFLPCNFVFVYLHECGGITRCEISKDLVSWSEPSSWEITGGPTHAYCYGCSDVDTVKGE